MTRNSTVLLASLMLVLGGLSFGVSAQSKSKLKSEEKNSYPAKQKAVHHVKRETGGQILGVKQLSSGADQVWRVKFLKDGKIKFMDVTP